MQEGSERKFVFFSSSNCLKAMGVVQIESNGQENVLSGG